MKNTRTKRLSFSFYILTSFLSFVFVLGCSRQVFEQDGGSSSFIPSSSSLKSPVQSSAASSKTSSSSQDISSSSQIQELRSYKMDVIDGTSGVLKILNDSLFFVGNGIFKADTLKRKWIPLDDKDNEYTYDIVSFNQTFYRLSSPTGRFQYYNNGRWKSAPSLSSFEPQHMALLNDTLLWNDGSSFNKIYSESVGFQAKWNGLGSELTESIQTSPSGEVGICRKTFRWLDREQGIFLNSGEKCSYAFPYEDQWLTFDISISNSKLRIMDGNKQTNNLNLPYDTLPQVFNDSVGALLFYAEPQELYRVSSTKISKSPLPNLPQNTQSILWKDSLYIAVNDEGKLYFLAPNE